MSSRQTRAAVATRSCCCCWRSFVRSSCLSCSVMSLSGGGSFPFRSVGASCCARVGSPTHTHSRRHCLAYAASGWQKLAVPRLAMRHTHTHSLTHTQSRLANRNLTGRLLPSPPLARELPCNAKAAATGAGQSLKAKKKTKREKIPQAAVWCFTIWRSNGGGNSNGKLFALEKLSRPTACPVAWREIRFRFLDYANFYAKLSAAMEIMPPLPKMT